MHKARLKKLETKQRAQEELRKRDAEIQRVREPEARTPFNNYRKHIAGLLYRNIVSIVPPFLGFELASFNTLWFSSTSIVFWLSKTYLYSTYFWCDTLTNILKIFILYLRYINLDGDRVSSVLDAQI